MEELDVIEDDLTFEGHCSIDYGRVKKEQRIVTQNHNEYDND